MECSCGKLISRHMHGKCLVCRYAEVKDIVTVKQKEPVRCKYCGKEFWQDKGRKYCSPECQKMHERETQRAKGQKIITKTCSICGEEFHVKKSSTRELCLDCKHTTKRSYKPKETADSNARAEKMRKIKASGMTYGQYMANNGIKPKDPYENNGALPETQAWMQGPKTIEVHPDTPPPKARIKRKVE